MRVRRPVRLVAWTAVGLGILRSLGGCQESMNDPAGSVAETGGGATADAELDRAVATESGAHSGQDANEGAVGKDTGVGSGLDASGGNDVGVTSPDSGIDSGPDASAADASDPLSFPAQCTSGVTWNGVTEDQNMRPGEVCPTCHSNFNIAGTLYPTGHEPNDCDGVDGLTTDVTVMVTDATGNVATLYPNAVGNFYTSITITPPFHAKVVLNGKERAMTDSQTNGACNDCHTQTGANGAPGRITLPP
jgi:hypothetical protein